MASQLLSKSQDAWLLFAASTFSIIFATKLHDLSPPKNERMTMENFNHEDVSPKQKWKFFPLVILVFGGYTVDG